MCNRMIVLLLSLSLSLVPRVAPAGSQAADPTTALRQAIHEAEEALAANEPEIAESRYRTALLEGWLLKGSLANEAGRPEDARAAFERAAVVAFETRRPHMSLALVELQTGEPERAASLLRGLVTQNRSDAAVRRLLPRALMAAGQVAEAIQEMEELHALDPQGLENTYALARAYLGQQRLEDAAVLFAELAQRRPIAQTHVLIGRTYRDFDLYSQAREHLRAALALDPRVPRAHYYLGSVDLLDQGQDLLEEAMGHFSAELEVTPEDPMANLYLGVALVEKRRHGEAVPHLELAGRRVTGRADAFQFLGRAYLGTDRLEDAIAAFRRGLELAEAAPEPIAVRGPDDAKQRQLSSLHFHLAQALRRSGKEEAAAVHFAAAKDFSARSAEGARELLSAYFRDDQTEDGLAASTWPLELSPLSGVDPRRRAAVEQAVTRGLVQAYFNLGVMQTKAGRFGRAAALYARAAELEPSDPQLQYALGTALFNDGQFERATAPLERALDEPPGDESLLDGATSVSLRENLRRMLALARFNSGDYGEAAELLRDDPERAANPSLEYAYAVALVRSGRAAQAEEVFAGLLAENADWPELNVLLGQARAQQNDFETAEEYLLRALELEPGVAEAHGTLGDIYLRQGKLDRAEEALRAELRSHPEDMRAKYTLAVVLDRNRKPDAALEVLNQLLAAQPDLADGRYLLGKILLARGAAEQARAQLEAAAALSPGDANIRYQLGQAYQRLGQRDKAGREFAEYRRLKQDPAGEGP